MNRKVGKFMTGKRFDDIVEALAQNNAKAIADKFIEAVRNAILEVDKKLKYSDPFWEQSMVVNLLSQLTTNRNFRVWPESILANEREKVQKELLATMDIMQKAIIAADESKPEITFGKYESEK